jgi:hypothetical protein
MADRIAKPELLERTFSTAEICAHLRIDARTLRRRLIENPQIRPMRAGRANVFTRSDVEALEEVGRRRYDASRPASERELASLPSDGRSATDMLRALRRRETKRLLAGLRKGG